MKSSSRDGALRGGYATVIRLLLLIAAGVSVHLLLVSLSGGNAIGCGPGSDCDVVLQSRWSKVLGMPVSLFALVVDLGLLLTTFSCGSKSLPQQRRKAWELLLPGSLLVLGAALWFTALQFLVIHHICPWCMTAHGAGTIAAVMLLLKLPVRETIERREKEPAVSRSTAVKLAVVALLAFALFAVAQMLVAPKTFEVKAIPSAVTNAPTPAITLAQTSARPSTVTNTPPPNWLGLYGGAFKVNLNEVPMWGSPEAPRKLVSLYDYSCHVCAEMHSRVAAVAREFGPKLAVVSLPMPLDSKCNPMIRRTPPAHTNACAYARLGLALWRTKPSAIEAYDDWFFDVFVKSEARIPNGQPPSYEEAKTHALQLAGDPVKFEQALHDAWIDQQIAASVALFGIGWKQYHNDRMPQFIIGTNLVSGIVDTAQLKAIVAKYVNAP